MNTKRFSIVQTLKFAFSESLEHIFFFFTLFFTWLLSFGFVMTLLASILLYPMRGAIIALLSQLDRVDKSELSRMVIETVSKDIGMASLILLLVGFVVYHFLQFGLIRIAFDMHDKGSSKISELFSGWSILFKGLAVSVIYYLLVIGGLALFVIPGVIAAITFGLALYIVIDKKCGVFEAFRESARLTKGTRTHIFGLSFVIAAIKQLCMGVFALGYIVFWPVGMLAMVYVYRKLQATVFA